MRPYCEHALPKDVAARAVVHPCGSCGACQRSSPVGGLAKGMPFQEKAPDASAPRTWPRCVWRTSGSEPPPPPQAESATAMAPRINVDGRREERTGPVFLFKAVSFVVDCRKYSR